MNDKRNRVPTELLKKISEQFSLSNSNNRDIFFSDFIIKNFSNDKVFLESIVQNMKNLICCYFLIYSLKGNYIDIFLKRLDKLSPEQILKLGNYNRDLTPDISIMIDDYIKWTEELEVGVMYSVRDLEYEKLKYERKGNEILEKRYLPIILTDKRLILNYMYYFWIYRVIRTQEGCGLMHIWGKDNVVKEAISFLEKQNLTKEEKLILDDFKKNEKEPYQNT